VNNKKEVSAKLAGQVSLGKELSVNRLGFGAMRLTGEGIFGPPKDRKLRSRFCAEPQNLTSTSSIRRILTVHM